MEEKTVIRRLQIEHINLKVLHYLHKPNLIQEEACQIF